MLRRWQPRRTGAVRSVVKNLRRKLDNVADNPTYIFAEPDVGYRVAEAQEQECWQPAKVAHALTREIRGRMEV